MTTEFLKHTEFQKKKNIIINSKGTYTKIDKELKYGLRTFYGTNIYN